MEKQFRNMTEMEPEKVKVYKNTQHCNSKVNIVHICMDKNMLMTVLYEKQNHWHEVNFLLYYALCMTKCAVLNFS